MLHFFIVFDIFLISDCPLDSLLLLMFFSSCHLFVQSFSHAFLCFTNMKTRFIVASVASTLSYILRLLHRQIEVDLSYRCFTLKWWNNAFTLLKFLRNIKFFTWCFRYHLLKPTRLRWVHNSFLIQSLNHHKWHFVFLIHFRLFHLYFINDKKCLLYYYIS